MAAANAEPEGVVDPDDPQGATDDLPPGHPRIDGPQTGDPADPAVGAQPVGPTAPSKSPLAWHAPPRWQAAANTSAMRIATYHVPRAPGDAEDAELSITQAGGSVAANADRWVGQFDADGQRTAKRTTRKVGPLDVTVVEVEGTYSGGMGMDSRPRSGWALLGAIVETPGTPCFFKLTGPEKTVQAAHAEFDSLIGSLVVAR